ncbi:subtilisin-like protein [Penicillium herquei]|nr:subtilisin-like protein [Penicillium herquei]
MDEGESQGLLKSWLGFLARKQPERSTNPASLRSRAREAWLRTDAFLQHDSDELDDDPESVAKALRALENYIQDDSDPDSVCVLVYGKLQSFGFSAF